MHFLDRSAEAMLTINKRSTLASPIKELFPHDGIAGSWCNFKIFFEKHRPKPTVVTDTIAGKVAGKVAGPAFGATGPTLCHGHTPRTPIQWCEGSEGGTHGTGTRPLKVKLAPPP